MKVQNHNKLSTESKKLLAVRLGWWILEQKLFYYYAGKYGQCVDDTIYDYNEDVYKQICKELGIKATACDNVGFPLDTPSGKLVISKFEGNKKAPLTSLVISNARKVKVIEEPVKRVRTRTRPKIEAVENPVDSVDKPVRTRTRKRPDESKRVRIRPRKRCP